MKPIILLALLFAPAALIADVATTRTAFGTDKAPALESLVASLYPGSVVEWEPRLAIVAADGTRRALRINDSVQRNEAAGFTFVMPLEFPEDETDIKKSLSAFEPAVTVVRPEIVAFKTSSSYAITEIRRGGLSETAHLTEVVNMEIAETGVDLEWPEVYFTYRAVYGTTEWHGELGWGAKLTTNPVAVVHRLPNYVVKQVKDAPLLAEEPVVIVNSDIESFTIFSIAGRKAVTRCAVPCVPDGRVLLALW